jgi:chromosome segregation ATPase
VLLQESSIDRKVDEAVALKLKDADHKHEAFEEQESALLAQLESTNEALQNLQKVHDNTQSQLFDLRTEVEASKAAKQDELEALMEELEKAQERAQGLERVNEGLSRELERVREGLGKDGPEQSLSDMEGNLRSKERLISKLHQQMQQLEQELAVRISFIIPRRSSNLSPQVCLSQKQLDVL